MTQQCTRGNNNYFRSPHFCILVLAVLATAPPAYPQRPPLAQPPPPPPAQVQLENLNTLAPSSVSDTDPSMCPTPGSPDPNETSIGGLSTHSVYKFSSQPNLKNLYARLVYEVQLCTGNSLSSQDEKAVEKALNFLKITAARSFAAKLSLTGDGQGGIKYPSIVPFSYSFDESSKKYSAETISKGVIPWQVTNAFEVQYLYNANKNVSINTATLFSDIVTAAAGAGGITALLSPAANAYLSVGKTVLDDLAQSVFAAINTDDNSFHFDMLQDSDRRLYYRFRDLSNHPLAAVRLTVAFTNSIANPVPVDPLKDDSAHVPQFNDAIQNILIVGIGGPSGGQTLLQAISKETSYQDILKATADTTAQSFQSSCDDLESKLQTTYGLNDFDTSLTMGQILSQENTLYLNVKKFYNSGCFRHRDVLKTMGITVFEHAPSS